MFKHRALNTTIATLTALMISNVPHIAFAEVAGGMISTTEVVEQISRSQAQQNIRVHIERTEVKEQLQKLGLNPDEISQRLASLSDSELRDMSKQMDQAQYGGDVTGILVIVLLVVLIIYLAKRI